MKLSATHAFNCIALMVKFGRISCEDITPALLQGEGRHGEHMNRRSTLVHVVAIAREIYAATSICIWYTNYL